LDWHSAKLLDWTGWLTLDEFNAQVKKLVESHAVTMGDTVQHYDGSTSLDVNNAQPGDTIMHYDGTSEVVD
jgi:hypothetical protein